MIKYPKSMVVIAPHPDDETLGAGGTIAKFVENGTRVSILIVSGHLPPLYSNEDFKKTSEEAISAFEILGVNNFEFLKIPATTVHELPVATLNEKIGNFINIQNPDVVLIPFPDRHIDHRTIFEAAVVSCRPVSSRSPKTILAYETLSETHWNVPGVEPNFIPELFVNIDDTLECKLKALKQYVSQIKNNNSRSVEACKALAHFRGSQNGCNYAEAYKVIRIVI